MTKILIECNTDNTSELIEKLRSEGCIADIIKYDSSEKYDKSKLRMLSSIINDISDCSNTERNELDDDEIAVYDSISNLKESLEQLGY